MGLRAIFKPHHAALLAAALAGCGTVPMEGAPLPAGERARMEYRVVAGNSGITWHVEVDSATGAYRTECTSQRGFPCGDAFPVRNGTLSRGQVSQLFVDASGSDFNALRPEYDMSGTFVDGPAYSIAVAANGRFRSIRWSDAAKLPTALSRVVNRIRTATGT